VTEAFSVGEALPPHPPVAWGAGPLPLPEEREHLPLPKGEVEIASAISGEGVARTSNGRAYCTISQVTVTRALYSLSPASTGTAAIFSMA